jgi:hypothetical protein
MSEQVIDTEKVEEKPIDLKAYEQTKNDMFKFKREAQEKEAKLAEMQAKLEELEKKGLEGSQQYKQLYENEANKRKELEGKYSELSTSLVKREKFSAVEQAAIKAGIRDLSDIEGFDFEGVEIETTNTGRYRVIGAEDWIEGLKKNKPHWFKDASVANINNSTGNFDNKAPKKLSATEILELQKKDPEAYKKYMASIFKK